MIKANEILEVVIFLENKKRSRSSVDSSIRGYRESKGVDGVKEGSLHDFIEFKYLPARKDIVDRAKRFSEQQLLFNAHNYCLENDVP